MSAAVFRSSANVWSVEQALVYMTECTLATVSSMAMRKSRPKNEYERQIAIAQNGIDWISKMVPENVGYSVRVREILNGCGGNVTEWAKQYEK